MNALADDRGVAVSAEILRTILDHIPTPVVCTAATVAAKTLYINHLFTRTFGYTAADIAGAADWAQLAYPDPAYRQELMQPWEADVINALADGSTIPPREARVQCKDGSKRDVIIHTATSESMVFVSFIDVTDEKKAQDALRSSEEKFRLMFEHASAGIFLVGLDGRILKTNRKANTMFGYSPGELEGLTVNDLALPDDTQLSPQAMQKLMEGQADHSTIEKRYRHKDGRIVRGLVSIALLRNKDQQPLYFVSQVQDISLRYELEEKLRISDERYRLLADNVLDVLWTIQLDGQITYMSPSLFRYRGFTPEELMQMPLKDQFTPESFAIVAQGLETARADVAAGRPVNFRSEVQELCKDGRIVWTEITATSLYDREGRFLEIVGMSRNIDERKQHEQALRKLATTDTLTGVWNRRHLEEVARQEIDRAQRYGETLTLIIFDVDHFKAINDHCGHLAGDRVLIELVTRVKDQLRVVDGLGRWGGEEFVVLMPHCDAAAGTALAEKLRGVVADSPFAEAGKVTVSFGVAQLQPRENYDQWFKRTDDAMYAAKAQGRNRVIVAEPV